MNAIFAALERRRARLRMSKVDLAFRANVSLPTVRRILGGHEGRPRIDIVGALAAALGVEVRLGADPAVIETVSSTAFREAQARAKARRIVGLVQGTMALEADAVGLDTLAELEEENVLALLAGPARRLWSET